MVSHFVMSNIMIVACYNHVIFHDGSIFCLIMSYIMMFISDYLCSPCVLDRLNALLEPGGVLTINERGVTSGDDTVPTVVPHPDFRFGIFLLSTACCECDYMSILLMAHRQIVSGRFLVG